MKITLQKLSTKDLATLAQRIINSSKNGNYTVVENLYQENKEVYHELLKAKDEQIALLKEMLDKK